MVWTLWVEKGVWNVLDEIVREGGGGEREWGRECLSFIGIGGTSLGRELISDSAVFMLHRYPNCCSFILFYF